MIRLLMVCLLASVAGCTHTSVSTTSVSNPVIHTNEQTKPKIKKKKQTVADRPAIVVRYEPACTKPTRPKPLARPLPLESPKELIDRLTAKLVEWVNYGDRVEKNC